MYYSDSCEKLFAYKCDNYNRCLFFKVMTDRLSDLNQNTAIKTNEIMGDSDSEKSAEVRHEEVLALRIKFPNKIPIIIKRYAKEITLPQLDKCKYLVPQEITMSQFQTIIRSRMQLGPSQALYLLVNNRSMLNLSLTLAEVYSNYAGPDGFLYITYASQEVFGS